MSRRLLLYLYIILFFSLSFFNVNEAMSEDGYDFYLMWPVLQERWYFNLPSDVAVDNDGDIYVLDELNYSVKKYTSDGRFILKWGSFGSGDGEFFKPEGIAVDKSGNVYVADTLNNRIQKFSKNGDFILKWGSFGSGDEQFNQPKGITVDEYGYVYVADTFNHRIQKFTSNGQFVTKWGSEGDDDGSFSGIVAAYGFVYVADTLNNRIQKFDTSGNFLTSWGTPGSGDGEFNLPEKITMDMSGNIYVSDTGNNRIQKFNSNGIFIKAWGSKGSGNGQFDSPGGLIVGVNDSLYVADSNNDCIQVFSSEGDFVGRWGSNDYIDGFFNMPLGIAIDNDNNVYVVDSKNNRIQKFDFNGGFIRKWGSKGSGNSQFNFPTGIAISSDNKLYVTDTSNHRVQVFTSEGVYEKKWGSRGNGDGQFNYPEGIAIDANGFIYVVDTGNHRVQKFDSNGNFISKYFEYGDEEGSLNSPYSIAFRNGDEYMYVSDSQNNRIQVFKKRTNRYSLSINKIGSGSGRVISTPSGIDCGSDCSEMFEEGMTVNLTATPDENSNFDGWSGGGCSGKGTCSVTMNAGKVITAVFSLKQGSGTPKISTNPNSLNFGTVKIEGTSSAKRVTIRNTGNGQLIINSIGIKGSDEFAQTNECSIIEPKGSCTVSVIFTPKYNYGNKVGYLEISSNDPKKPIIRVKLLGKTLPPVITVKPASINFGNVKSTGSPITKTLKINNKGVSDLIISSITIAGDNSSQFSQTNDCSSLGSKTFCTVNVTFTPDAVTGRKNATMVISNNDPKKPTLSVVLRANVKG